VVEAVCSLTLNVRDNSQEDQVDVVRDVLIIVIVDLVKLHIIIQERWLERDGRVLFRVQSCRSKLIVVPPLRSCSRGSFFMESWSGLVGLVSSRKVVALPTTVSRFALTTVGRGFPFPLRDYSVEA
jgi:hypothetical protein